jgi:transposase
MISRKVNNYIGADISKYWIDFAILTKSSNVLKAKFDNTLEGLKSFRAYLRANNVLLNKKTIVTMEHTGIYTRTLIKYLETKPCLTCVEHPIRIIKSIGITRGKNDSIDSERIAEYTKRNLDKLILWTEPRAPIRQLKDLLSIRERLMKFKHALGTPLREMKGIHARNYIRRLTSITTPVADGIKISLERVAEEIEAITNSDDAIKKQMDLLTSIPGIGKIISLLLICYTNEFTLYKTGKQLSCYVGVVPFKIASGTNFSSKGHVSHAANGKLKAYLHISALSMIQYNKELREYYEKKVKEGKHKMLVINNIKNKLLLRVAAVMQKKTPYQCNYDCQNTISKSL